MGVVLDTSVLVAAERDRFDLAAFLRTRPHEEMVVATITVSELLHGLERAQNSTRRERRAAFVGYVLTHFPAAPFTLATARVHARTWATLTRRGTPVGPHDLIAAATALEMGYDVATLDRREFERVPTLTMADVAGFVVP